jgi:hypothetical protein
MAEFQKDPSRHSLIRLFCGYLDDILAANNYNVLLYAEQISQGIYVESLSQINTRVYNKRSDFPFLDGHVSLSLCYDVYNFGSFCTICNNALTSMTLVLM